MHGPERMLSSWVFSSLSLRPRLTDLILIICHDNGKDLKKFTRCTLHDVKVYNRDTASDTPTFNWKSLCCGVRIIHGQDRSWACE